MSVQRITRICCDHRECATSDETLADTSRWVPPGWFSVDVRSYRSEFTLHFCAKHFPSVLLELSETEHATLEDMGDETMLGGIDAG